MEMEKYLDFLEFFFDLKHTFFYSRNHFFFTLLLYLSCFNLIQCGNNLKILLYIENKHQPKEKPPYRELKRVKYPHVPLESTNLAAGNSMKKARKGVQFSYGILGGYTE